MRKLLKKWLMTFFLCGSAISVAGNVHEYRLKNGLKLIVKEDHRAPVVLSSVWYKVGGSYEHDGLTGISHALEHMMFRGTKKYPAGQLEKIISKNGGEQNAATSNDQTFYYQRLAADKLPISFKLEADRMHNLLLTKADFTKEIQVVMEERRMRVDDDPNGLTYERFTAAAHVNNPYHHQAIGWMTDLQHMTADNLRTWYRTWYVPNNALVVVVGDVKPTAVLALAKKYFSSLKPAPVPQLKPRTEITPLGEKRIAIHVPAKLPLLLMGYQTPSLVTAKKSWQPYALDVLSSILGGGDSARFMQQLVRGEQIASVAQAGYDIYTLHSDLLTLTGVPVQGHSVSALQAAFLQQVKKLQTQPVRPEELERVKAQVIAQNVYQNDSLDNQALNIGIPESIGLSWRVDQQYVQRIKAVTPQQIQQVAKQYLIPARLTVAVLHPSTTEKAQPVTTQPVSPIGPHS